MAGESLRIELNDNIIYIIRCNINIMNSSNKSGKKTNNIVFKIKTPKGMINIKDIDDDLEKYITIDVVEFKTGKKLGNFKLEEFKLKFL